jgi:stage V sporulation protein AC
MGKDKLKGYLGAFIVGGLIGMIGHAILDVYTFLGIPLPFNVLLCIFTLAFIGGLLTFMGPYQKIAEIGGMGAAVPMSGLANGITGMIMGARQEGASNGQALKIGLTGPAKIFGSAFALGLILALIKMFMPN